MLLVLSYVSDLDVTFECYFGWSRQPDVIPRTVPVYSQVATARANNYRGVKKSALSLDGDCRTCSGTACERLAGATFIHAELDVRAINDFDEPGIHTIGKTRVLLDGRAKSLNGCGIG